MAGKRLKLSRQAGRVLSACLDINFPRHNGRQRKYGTAWHAPALESLALGRYKPMAFTLNRDMTQGPQDRTWRIRIIETHEDSNVVSTFDQLLPHDDVVRLFRDAMGGVPGNGIGSDDIVRNWDRLEPLLRAEIERLHPHLAVNRRG